MNWASASEFFAMGGYGLYVWGSYAVAAVVMVAEALLSRRRHRQALAQNRSVDPQRRLKA
jgi:heme exporter protein D